MVAEPNISQQQLAPPPGFAPGFKPDSPAMMDPFKAFGLMLPPPQPNMQLLRGLNSNFGGLQASIWPPMFGLGGPAGGGLPPLGSGAPGPPPINSFGLGPGMIPPPPFGSNLFGPPSTSAGPPPRTASPPQEKPLQLNQLPGFNLFNVSQSSRNIRFPKTFFDSKPRI
jgi:hypothetical protein